MRALGLALAVSIAGCASGKSGSKTSLTPSPVASAAGSQARPLDVGPTCKLDWMKAPLWGPNDPAFGPANARITVVWGDDPEHPEAPGLVDLLLREDPDVRVVFRVNGRPESDGRPLALARLARRARGDALFLAVMVRLHADREAGVVRPLADLARSLDLPFDDAAIDAEARREPLPPPLSAELGGAPGGVLLVNGIVVRSRKTADAKDAVRTARVVAREGEACRAFAARFPEAPKPDLPVPGAFNADDPRAVFRVPPGDAPGRGADEPLVVIVQFGGYQDPFTRRAHATLLTVLANHPGVLRVVYRDKPLPFHAQANASAILARLAFLTGGPRLFLEVHDDMMRKTSFTNESLDAIAKAHGIDPKELAKARGDKELLDAVAADGALGDSLGVKGTPTFFVNGRRLVGAQPPGSFEVVIGEELRRAQKLLEAGVPRAKVPEVATRDGILPPKP